MALTPAIRAVLGRVLAPANIPAVAMRVVQAVGLVVERQKPPMNVTQARVLVVARGVTARPRVRCWTMTLDNHDLYFLQTINETLVCDLSNGRWYIWGSESADIWRLHTGIPWTRSLALASVYGSNIVCGDNVYGVLYILNPEGTFDQHPDATQADLPFRRAVVGQIALTGRASVPCWGVEVYGSVGEQADGAYVDVTLYTSDDRGHTYDSQGTLSVDAGDYNTRLDWLSLGQMQAPGRLIMVEDFGAMVRIDGMEMPDAEPK